MHDLVLTPTDFVAFLNQTLEYAYPQVTIEGELSNFKVAKNRWVYFDLKDELSSVSFFGVVTSLPGPLEDGLKVRVVGAPRLHQRFGFSINFSSITPVGEGALKKAADLLRQKLQLEGLFALERKRLLPELPNLIGLITAANSAARADFMKILNERWGGVEVLLIDTLVQGDQAPAQLVAAIEHFNSMPSMPEVLVITRGGGSADDLAAFDDERVVRAVSASRVPTLIAIGHETDESLAELAADKRASTPSNAAASLTPDRKAELASLKSLSVSLARTLVDAHAASLERVNELAQRLSAAVKNLLSGESERLKATARLAKNYDPNAALRRGYAIVSKNGHHIGNIAGVKIGDKLAIKLSGGTISSKVQQVKTDAR
jgi:exodeoxyribonuclease VII large subunit